MNDTLSCKVFTIEKNKTVPNSKSPYTEKVEFIQLNINKLISTEYEIAFKIEVKIAVEVNIEPLLPVI